MKKTLILGLALALVGGVAYANFCARDYVPAATLLVPYAVVDLDANGAPNPNGFTTLLSVTNVSSTKQLIHVVVWDAQSNGIVDFDEVLSGYDVWTINFRDLLAGNFNLFDTGDPDKTDNGSGPKPGSVPPQPQVGDFVKGTAFTAGAQPWGPYTNQPYLTTLPLHQDIDFATPLLTNCNFPYGNLASYGPTITNLLRAAIVPVGQDSSDCRTATVASPPYLTNLTSNPVFFYVTVDVVNACSQNFPPDDAYWTAPIIPSNNNVIIGDIIYLNQTANFSDSVPAVAIEADLDWTGQGFYSRYSQNVTVPVADFHEPLGTAFAFRYYDSGGVTSNLMVWKNNELWRDEFYRDKNGTPTDADACVSYIYYAFDENENSKARGGGGPSGFNTAEPNILPYETQKVPLDLANWNGLMSNNGWMLLVFDPSIVGAANIPLGEGIQAWVGVQYYFGTYSTALEAATLGNVWCFAQDVVPALNTYKGVSGDGLRGFVPTP
jgi:hypothetical protein